jgi:hypothetical protein
MCRRLLGGYQEFAIAIPFGGNFDFDGIATTSRVAAS